MILRDCVDIAVIAGVEIDDTFIVVVQVNGFVIGDVVIEVQQKVGIHIHLNGVGVGPEHIRQVAAVSAGFQKGPVVVPVNDVDVDINTGLC